MNEAVWARGIRHPPIKIKIKATKEPDSDIVKVELAEMPKQLGLKKIREEKIGKEAAETKKKKTVEEKPLESEEAQKEKEEKKKDEKEKKASVVEAGKQFEKSAARQAKHRESFKTKESKHEFRKALQK